MIGDRIRLVIDLWSDTLAQTGSLPYSMVKSGITELLEMARQADRLEGGYVESIHDLLRSAAASLPAREPVVVNLAAVRKRRLGDPVDSRMKSVLTAVCTTIGNMTPDVLRGDRRDHRAVHARHIAAYVAHRSTGLSAVDIGRALGGRDRTAIAYALERVADLRKREAATRDLIEDIEDRLRSFGFEFPKTTPADGGTA